MSDVFFISDTHFGHKNIIKFGHRPFTTVEEHNDELVHRWNSVVSKRDLVWHLGDVAFGLDNLKIMARLNGTKKLVLGNHDVYQPIEYLKYFSKIYGAAEYKGFILTHIPVHEGQFNRFSANIHGHLHQNNILSENGGKDKRYINVSCEQINLTPINFNLINIVEPT